MASRKSYNRFFIILQEDQKGYGTDTSKTPSGYAKLETMSDKAKASFYIQNLRKQKGPYNMVLIVQGKNERELINLGSINIDDMGKADISNDYSSDNIANTHISMDKVEGAAICRISDNKVIPVMVGFSGGEEYKNWYNFPIASCIDKNDKVYTIPLRKDENKAKDTYSKEVKKTETVKAKAKSEIKEKMSAGANIESGVNKKAQEKRSDNKTSVSNEASDLNISMDSLKEEAAKLQSEREELRKGQEQLEAEKEALRKEQEKLEAEKAALKEQQDKLLNDIDKFNEDLDKNRLEKEQLEAEKIKIGADREQLDKDIDTFNQEKEAFEKEKKECDELKKSQAGGNQTSEKSKCSICKYIKIKRDDGEDEYVPIEDAGEERIEGQSFEDYEQEIENYKEIRSKKCKDDKEYDEKEGKKKSKEKCDKKDKDDKWDKKKYKEECDDHKCKTYPKEHKEEFFNSVVDGLEKLEENDNIKNCKWYKANIDKLESMYCVYDYNKYAILFYPMICYYPYISKSKEFRIGYKYDDDNKLRYIIYAIPGTKDLEDQPYEGKTGFVTFMPDRNDENKGCWLMYYDIDENTVVVPIMK